MVQVAAQIPTIASVFQSVGSGLLAITSVFHLAGSGSGREKWGRTSTLLTRLLLSPYWPDRVTGQLLAARESGECDSQGDIVNLAQTDLHVSRTGHPLETYSHVE